MNEACCLSVVAALDKFHRRLVAVQRILVSDQPRSFVVITEVARTISNRTSNSLLTHWKEQLQGWKDSWNNENQPHASVKVLEGVLVEHIHRALVALTVIAFYLFFFPRCDSEGGFYFSGFCWESRDFFSGFSISPNFWSIFRT